MRNRLLTRAAQNAAYRAATVRERGRRALYLWSLGLLLSVIAPAADVKPPELCNVSGGVVNAATSEPIKKAQLTLRSVASGPSYTATTDDSGSFSLHAVEAGKYELVIQRRGFVHAGQSLSLHAGQTVTDTIIRLLPQGVITGHAVDGDGEPIAGVLVQAMQSRYTSAGRRYLVSGTGTTNDLGEFRIFGLTPGRHYLGGTYRTEAGYAAVYYPQAQEAREAVAIDVPAGGEVRGLYLVLSEIRALKIRGTIQSGARVALQGITIVAAPCDAGPLNLRSAMVQSSNGAFELRDLAPGCYLLAADSFSSGLRYSARLLIDISDKTIEGVNLTLVPPIQLAGRVHGDGPEELKLAGPVVVNLESRVARLTASGVSGADGSLALSNIVPEHYELSVVVPANYYLKSAHFGDTDVLESGLDLTRGGNSKLDLEISDAGGRIDGIVAGKNEQPIPGASVVLIPADARHRSSRYKARITNEKGAFSIRDIAPGEYRVYGSQSVDAAAFQDPDYLKQLESQGSVISIKEHAQTTVHVKAIPSHP